MRHFFAHVAGESFANDDGSDRQGIIASCRVGEPLLLVPDPDNTHDENAVRVLRPDGKQIGYLERGMAARLVDDLSDFHAFIAGVGRGGGPYLGVALLVVVNDGQDGATIAAYARRVLEEEGNLTRQRGSEGRSRRPIARALRLTMSRERGDDKRDNVPLPWAFVALAAVAGGAGVVFWWLLR